MRLLMLGAGETVKFTPLLLMPPAAVITTLPVVVPLGTVAVILLVVQLVMVAAVPLNFTALPAPWALKFVPAITMADPTAPVLGVRLLMLGAGETVKLTPLLATPPAVVTTTLPVVAPVGTVAVMLLVVQLVMVAAVPLNFTALPAPWALKFDPAMMMDDPTAPVLGVRVLMLGAGDTVKLTPVLATPPAAVTTTLPVVAPLGTVAVMLLVVQLVMVAVVPLNVTALPAPWVLKFVPAMTMAVPTAPVLGVNEVMLGAEVTVNVVPALA